MVSAPFEDSLELVLTFTPKTPFYSTVFRLFRETWKKHFPKRDLLAYSAAPLLLYPTHYTGEEGYISDTENSSVIHKVSTDIREDL